MGMQKSKGAVCYRDEEVDFTVGIFVLQEVCQVLEI